MSEHFVYIWFDKIRKMYYVGQHTGSINDSYTCSSRWLAGEIRFRPGDFRRRIIKFFTSKNEAQKYESYLLSLIPSKEFGRRYYNIKSGAPVGNIPWNFGKTGVYSEERNRKISERRKGKPTTKGKLNPQAVLNGKKGAAKQSITVTGRRRQYRDDGSWFWYYPNRLVDSVAKYN